MKIAVAVKVVPDDQDIQVAPDGSLDYSKAHQIVSTYDLNAIEAAVRIAAEQGGKVTVIAAGPAAIDDSKLKKNMLARGADDLIMVADDSCLNMDAYATADVLAGIVRKAEGVDLVLCGDGSADEFAQQVDVQLSAALGWPVVNAAVKVEIDSDSMKVTRMLEDEIETVEVSLPAVVSVTPDIAQPRIPGMKDILAAGKKPMEVGPVDAVPTSSLEVIECFAPDAANRACKVVDAADENAIQDFAAAIKAAL